MKSPGAEHNAGRAKVGHVCRRLRRFAHRRELSKSEPRRRILGVALVGMLLAGSLVATAAADDEVGTASSTVEMLGCLEMDSTAPATIKVDVTRVSADTKRYTKTRCETRKLLSPVANFWQERDEAPTVEGPCQRRVATTRRRRRDQPNVA